ncbi:hypothetical protein [Pseudomonas syringae]|uniref:hypothetical protein n=1 Tax=Pseudomonas syringae TaxID=317 RepID=UPI0002E91B85|nr:hypothetical protein [Pseudomonas syringae]
MNMESKTKNLIMLNGRYYEQHLNDLAVFIAKQGYQLVVLIGQSQGVAMFCLRAPLRTRQTGRANLSHTSPKPQTYDMTKD